MASFMETKCEHGGPTGCNPSPINKSGTFDQGVVLLLAPLLEFLHILQVKRQYHAAATVNTGKSILWRIQ